MIYPDVSAEEWITRFPTLEVETEKCVVCRRKRVADIPFIKKDWAGFTAPECECGQKRHTFTIRIPLNGKYENLCELFTASIFASDMKMYNDTCPICGGMLIGDGYDIPIHCENVDIGFDVKADSGPYYCEETNK